MANAFVQVAPDGTGKKVDNSTLTVAAETVYRQRVVLASDENPSALSTIFPAGFLRVTDEPTQLFYDPFETLDATERWLAGVSAGGGVAPAVAAGDLTLGTGTTANGYATRSSRNVLTPPIPAWLGVSFAIRLEFPITANAYRFWGIGQKTGTPTAAAPVTDGVGFEIGTDGKLYAVVYSNSVRTATDLSTATGNSKQPADALGHRYIVYYRTDRIYWYIDSLDNPVATASFVSPQVQLLPIHLAAIAGSVAPASSGVLTVIGLAAWDTGKNAVGISDPTYPWRKAGVVAKGVQGGFAIAAQDLKDSGRQACTITFNTSAPVVAETLVSAVKTLAGVAAGGATSIGVTSGKRLRITNVILSVRATAATTPWASLQIRTNPAGATVIGSPSLMRIECGGTAAVVGNTGHINVPINEAMEFSGAETIGLTLATNVVTNIVSITLVGYEY